MYLVVGLGNPGDRYDKTRHNVGFDIVDLCENKYNLVLNRVKFKGIYGETTIGSEKVIFLKPQTFMNLSGESVRSIIDFYKIPTENIIVIYDDVSLEVGRLRIKTKGSAGGHNGIKNIIAHIGTDEFPRIKVGVGEPTYDLVKFVTDRFTSEDRNIMEKSFMAAVDAIQVMVMNGPGDAMNKFNSFKASID
ncbi:MAG: aminoacyl-tRNA hydrolase [Clostridium sp.]|uniref:aminoacyl-tRNA hydrolase n=1 Tax=Clostridium sp. TaxID=1506 RepID=UPI003020FBFF